MSATEANSIAVIGAGTMGVGIAYVAALAGMPVAVVEPDNDRAEGMRRTIQDTVASAIGRGKLDQAGGDALARRITHVAAVEDLAAELSLIVESIPERVDLKFDVLARCAARRPRLLASNTSALSIDRLSQAVSDPGTFLGMHFFNPVWSIKLVELVRGAATSEATLATARAFVAALGKESLTVRDVPGFATSRLDLIASLEAMRMLESGVASAADIDPQTARADRAS